MYISLSLLSFGSRRCAVVAVSCLLPSRCRVTRNKHMPNECSGSNRRLCGPFFGIRIELVTFETQYASQVWTEAHCGSFRYLHHYSVTHTSVPKHYHRIFGVRITTAQLAVQIVNNDMSGDIFSWRQRYFATNSSLM